MRFPLAFVLAVALAAVSPALARPNETARVVPGPVPQSFAVPVQGMSAAGDFWCVAGRHARRELGAAYNERLYRYAPVPPRRSGQPMVFGFDRGNAVAPGLLILSRDAGMSVGHAVSLCDRVRDD